MMSSFLTARSHPTQNKQGSTGGSTGHYQLGLRILVMLVGEMNQPTPGRTLTAHRKVLLLFPL